MRFLQLLWQCFFTWNIPSSPLKSADVILSFADEATPDGTSVVNEYLARIVRELYTKYSLPLILQGEVARYLTDLPMLATIPEQQYADRRITTREGCELYAALCRKHGFSRAIFVAHPPHLWRSVMGLRRFGLEVLVPPIKWTWETQSAHFWARNRPIRIALEIVKRLEYLLKGWI